MKRFIFILTAMLVVTQAEAKRRWFPKNPEPAGSSIYYSGAGTYNSSGTLSTNTAAGTPITIGQTGTLTKVEIRGTTFNFSVGCRVGIYDDAITTTNLLDDLGATNVISNSGSQWNQVGGARSLSVTSGQIIYVWIMNASTNFTMGLQNTGFTRRQWSGGTYAAHPTPTITYNSTPTGVHAIRVTVEP